MLDELAADLDAAFGDNHRSSIMFSPSLHRPEDDTVQSVRVLSIVRRFSPDAVHAAAELASKYTDLGFAGPYLLTEVDIEGMVDSVPDQLLDIMSGYQLVAGEDLLAPLLDALDLEHIRAQTEQRVRNIIIDLRWDLVGALDEAALEAYLTELGHQTLFVIQLYHLLRRHPPMLLDEHIDRIIDAFPAAKEPLQLLAAHVYEGRGLSYHAQLELVIEVLYGVLLPLLTRIDTMTDADIAAEPEA